MLEKVQKWIEEGRNFEAGIAILTESGKEKNILKIITGRPRYADKLFYLLTKHAGLRQILPLTIIAPIKIDTEGKKLPKDKNIQQKTKDNQVPAEIEKLIKLHADLFKERAIMHEAMGNLPTANTDAINLKRKELSDKIAEHSAKIDILFTAKENFYKTGTIVTLAELFPEKPADKPKEEFVFPTDEDGLKKMKKNLQSANTKDQNLLEYQNEKKGNKPAPMPKGPKRTKIELRIDNRKLTITDIDTKLLKFAAKNK